MPASILFTETEAWLQGGSSFGTQKSRSRTSFSMATKHENLELLAPVRLVIEDLAKRYPMQQALAKALGMTDSQLSNFRAGISGLGIRHLVSIARVSGQGLDALLGRDTTGKVSFSSAELFELVARDAGLPEATIAATRGRYMADAGRSTNALKMLRFAEWHAGEPEGTEPSESLAEPAPIAKKRQAGRSK